MDDDGVVDDWQTVKDPQSGATYFSSAARGRSSWTFHGPKPVEDLADAAVTDWLSHRYILRAPR
jgi:hypothetical protein